MKKNTAVFNSICEITKEHIKEGLPEEGDRCPIALAMSDSENGKLIDDTDETPLQAYVSSDGEIKISAFKSCVQAGVDIELEYNIDIHPDDVDKVKSFVSMFDDDISDVEPFEFRYKPSDI